MAFCRNLGNSSKSLPFQTDGEHTDGRKQVRISLLYTGNLDLTTKRGMSVQTERALVRLRLNSSSASLRESTNAAMHGPHSLVRCKCTTQMVPNMIHQQTSYDSVVLKKIRRLTKFVH